MIPLEEYAALCDMNAEYLRQLAKKGGVLGAFQVGKAWYYSETHHQAQVIAAEVLKLLNAPASGMGTNQNAPKQIRPVILSMFEPGNGEPKAVGNRKNLPRSRKDSRSNAGRDVAAKEPKRRAHRTNPEFFDQADRPAGQGSADSPRSSSPGA